MGTSFQNICHNLFTENPERAHELFKHLCNIRAAASAYIWGNVYLYDVTFRELMDRNPSRNWGVNFYQHWDVILKEWIDSRPNHFSFNTRGRHQQVSGKQESKDNFCWHFNKGKCQYGSNCHFEHKCYLCNRMDHGAVSCSAWKDNERQGNAGNAAQN